MTRPESIDAEEWDHAVRLARRAFWLLRSQGREIAPSKVHDVALAWCVTRRMVREMLAEREARKGTTNDR